MALAAAAQSAKEVILAYPMGQVLSAVVPVPLHVAFPVPALHTILYAAEKVVTAV